MMMVFNVLQLKKKKKRRRKEEEEARRSLAGCFGAVGVFVYILVMIYHFYSNVPRTETFAFPYAQPTSKKGYIH